MQAAWSTREKELQEEQQSLSKKLRLQADLAHKADTAAQAKVSGCHSASTTCCPSPSHSTVDTLHMMPCT